MEAVEIAKQFVMDEYKESKITRDYSEYKISYEKGGFGQTVLGLNESYWSVTFTLQNTGQDMAVFDNDYFIVLVDAESGEPNWLPV